MAILNYRHFIDDFNKKLKGLIIDSGLVEMDEQGYQRINKAKMMYRARIKNPLMKQWQHLDLDNQIKKMVQHYTPRHAKTKGRNFKRLFNSLVAPKHLVDKNVKHAQDLQHQAEGIREEKYWRNQAHELHTEDFLSKEEQQHIRARAHNQRTQQEMRQQREEEKKRLEKQKLQEAYKTVAKHMGVDPDTIKDVFEDKKYNEHVADAANEANQPASTKNLEGQFLSPKFVKEFNEQFTPEGQTNGNAILNDDVIVDGKNGKYIDWNKVNQNIDIAKGREPRLDHLGYDKNVNLVDGGTALNRYLEEKNGYFDLNAKMSPETAKAYNQSKVDVIDGMTNPDSQFKDEALDKALNKANRFAAKAQNEKVKDDLDNAKKGTLTRASKTNMILRDALNQNYAPEDQAVLSHLLFSDIDTRHGETMGHRFQEIHDLTHHGRQKIDAKDINESWKMLNGFRNKNPLDFLDATAGIADVEKDDHKIKGFEPFTKEDALSVANKYKNNEKITNLRAHGINPNNLEGNNLDLYVNSMRPTSFVTAQGEVKKGVLIQAKKRGDVEGQSSVFDGDFITNRKLPNGHISHSQFISYDSAKKILKANGINATDETLDQAMENKQDFGRNEIHKDRPMSFTANVFSPEGSKANDYAFNPNPDKIGKSEKPLGKRMMAHIEEQQRQDQRGRIVNYRNQAAKAELDSEPEL